MVQTLITGFLELIRNLIDIFLTPLINLLENLPGMSFIGDFVQGFTTIAYYGLEGGAFMKKFLMIPNGLITTMFSFITALIGLYVAILSIQFAIKIYNLFKGPV